MDCDRVKAWTGMLAYSVWPEDNKPGGLLIFKLKSCLNRWCILKILHYAQG